MFKSIFETGIELSIKSTIISLLVALILGFIISVIYILSQKGKRYSTNFAVTLVLLPAIVSVVIMMIGSDITKAVTLGGVFALVRFRSIPGDSKDIGNVFFAMAVGLAVGMGYLGIAVFVTVAVGGVYLLLTRLGYAETKKEYKVLKITIPENLNYQEAFDDLFETYTEQWELQRVRTTNMGTLYELSYRIRIRKDSNEKQFIDDIRCRNGNLNILLEKEAMEMQQL